MKPYSLLRRITAGLAATMVVASLCAFGWLYLKAVWMDAALRERTLLDQAKVIANYLRLNDLGQLELRLPPRLIDAYNNSESPYRFAIRDANGQYLFDGGMAVGPLPQAPRNQKLYDYDPDGSGPLHTYGAVLQATVGNRDLYIQVEQEASTPGYLPKAVVDEFLEDGGWLEVLFLFVLLGVSIFIVRGALAPLKRISNLAEAIGPANAGLRLPTDQVPAEILPLVRSVNHALDRLDHGLRQQRDFNGNAAHQLRTPLAVLKANIDLLQDEDTAARLRVDVDHMSRIVSQLLLAARLETLSTSPDEVVDLNDATAEIAAGIAPLAVKSGKSIELALCEQPVLIRTNTFALRAALANLIENAVKHTPEGTSVRLRVTEGPTIEVADSGPGVAPSLRGRIFERFWSGDRSKSGAGLGLSIVDQIMRALNGSVEVSDATGGGALFRLVFPATGVLPKASIQSGRSVASLNKIH